MYGHSTTERKEQNEKGMRARRDIDGSLKKSEEKKQQQVKAKGRPRKSYIRHSKLIQGEDQWSSGTTPAQHAGGPGFKSQTVHFKHECMHLEVATRTNQKPPRKQHVYGRLKRNKG